MLDHSLWSWPWWHSWKSLGKKGKDKVPENRLKDLSVISSMIKVESERYGPISQRGSDRRDTSWKAHVNSPGVWKSMWREGSCKEDRWRSLARTGGAWEEHSWEEQDLLFNVTRWTVREMLRDSSVEEHSKQICFYILDGWFSVEANWLFLMRLTLYICRKEYSKVSF